MKTSHKFLSIILLLGLAPPLSATDPAWWTTRAVITQSPASNLSPATIGQAKWMVSQALAEMETQLDTSHYQTLRSDVEAVMDLSLPVTQEDFDNQKKLLVIGQLKASAQPFYDILHSHYPAWLENQLAGNQTKDVNDSGNFYPWTTATTDDQNKALATVGQLKAVFSLRFELDTEPNGLPDFWEYRYFAQIGNDPNGDPDGDGLTTAQELGYAINPSIADTDGDGMPDGWEIANGLDPKDPNDANGDPDNDGLTNLQEYVLGLNPNSADNPGITQESITNGTFSAPDIGDGVRMGAPTPIKWDYWTTGIPGWTAINGTNIELQIIDPKPECGPYCELKAHPEGNNGIKQKIGTRKHMSYLLLLDCKDRANTSPENSNFDIKINGSTIKSITFATAGSWTTQAIPFKAPDVIRACPKKW
jgi:hypothetical protein